MEDFTVKKGLIFLFLSILFLAGCGNNVLVLRDVLEADQYTRNNATNMDWLLFEQILAEDTTVTKDDFSNFKQIIEAEAKNNSSFVKLGNTIYRFSEKYELIYRAHWKSDDGELKLYSLDYIQKRD